MSVIFVGALNFPNFICLHSDIVAGALPTAARIGNTVMEYDTGAWWIIKPDLSLGAFELPTGITFAGTVDVGKVDQGSKGTDAWLVDTELPSASALNGTILKSVSAPMVGAANMYSDGTNLVEVDSTHPLPVGGTIAVTGAGDASAANQTSVQVTIASPTVAPTKDILVSGKSNDATAQYQPIPEGAGGRSVIVEGYAGGTAQPVSLATAPALVAGEAHIGAVGGQGNTVGITFVHDTTTTQYTAKDSIGKTLTITGATNANPIVVAAASHGLSDGDVVTITGITGNTAANATAYVKVTTVGDSGHFGLYSDKALTTGIAGNGTYGGSPVCAVLFRIPNIFRVAGGSGYITKIRFGANSATWTDQCKIHFYGSAAISSFDNTTFILWWANETVRLGYSLLPALSTEGAGGDLSIALGAPGDGTSELPLFVKNLDNSQDLYFRLETLGTGTPTSGLNFYLEFTLDQN